MSYPEFHERHKAFAFHDTDGSPVYEDGWGGLCGRIVARNDLAALRLYHASPNTRVFWEGYEAPYWHPFFVAAGSGSWEALRALIEIYLTDPTYKNPEQPPLDQYLTQLDFSPINEACAAANREMVLWLLQHDPPLATLQDRDARGHTPLFSAASGLRRGVGFAEHEEFIHCLLNQGCLVSESDVVNVVREDDEEEDDDDDEEENKGRQDDDGNASGPSQPVRELEKTLLGAAVPYGSYHLTSRLIAEGAEVHVRQSWCDPTLWMTDEGVIGPSKEVTALHIASVYRNLEGIRALVDHRGEGVSVAEMISRRDDQGRIPLHWALLGTPDDKPRKENKDDDTEDDMAQEETIPSERLVKTVKYLLAANPETINARDRLGATVFHYAVRSRHMGPSSVLAVVEMLLDAGPLASTWKAVRNDERERDTFEPTILQDAVNGHGVRRGKVNDTRFIQLVETLLAHGADARLCLHRLCAERWIEHIPRAMLERLLQASLDIDETDADGCTAMHYLVRNMDQVEAARYLISRGADVDVVDDQGNTPLHQVMKGTLIRKLDEHGRPDPSQPKDAPVRARKQWIEMLVEAGGSMDRPNAFGKTPKRLLEELTERLEQMRMAEATQIGRGRGRGVREGDNR
ncbi:ankyrin [Aspergillus brunneoviolaceus CBS 621.78]|uniref:Ankyrin n=1 Tax=Aspergillus brunneoviolaceus CBS 621.78 TaxID=1450534 RepID=A0ACD1FVL8_9EURO|nr:ankyrin [Aspergillus brunneoviolaceus CBS 621.78]RAH41031.1 ankyrin [Aspergillus brunneoviolaceus CBS 621.78]